MEVQKSIKQSEMCRIPATSLCFECFMYLCDSCYKIIHDKIQSDKHKKENIDYFAPIDTKCPDHPRIPINLFCIDENGK